MVLVGLGRGDWMNASGAINREHRVSPSDADLKGWCRFCSDFANERGVFIKAVKAVHNGISDLGQAGSPAGLAELLYGLDFPGGELRSNKPGRSKIARRGIQKSIVARSRPVNNFQIASQGDSILLAADMLWPTFA